jgi:DnaJ-class molecular chaperone
MRRDYYAVLGVTATAGLREIRQAYRRLARQYSPDVNVWDHRANDLFAEISEAYRVLSDPAARALYDRFGHRGDAMLGSGRRGDDIHTTVEVGFAEAARGVDITVNVQRFSPCVQCGATGVRDDTMCAQCQGRGVRRVVEAVEVPIPAGVDSGTQIRVKDEGHAAPFGGPRGDLIVNTRVREHPFFTRQGDAVYCEVPISVWEALRGARIRVPTPTGETVLVVPPGTPPGREFRLRGHGLPKLTGDGIGDLYVKLRVEMPPGLDPHTDAIVRELERVLPIEPRRGLERYAGGEG